MEYRFLIIDDEEDVCYSLKRILERDKENIVVTYTNPIEAVKHFSETHYDIVITDLVIGAMNGLEVIENLKKTNPDIIIIMITGKGSDEIAEKAVKAGAYDYFSKPFNNTEFFKTIRNAKEKISLVKRLPNDLTDVTSGKFHKFSFSSEEGGKIVETLKKISKYDTTILITGESGTGKGILAESIHMESSRKDNPFVKVNCGAIPENLMEAELFGYEKGAFTGAGTSKKGKIELADGGTIFLDEIGEIDIKYQAKLLRVLEDGILEKVGSEKFVKVNVRIIAATNVDLEKAIEEKRFRLDLYYRLNTFKVEIPPLRNRKADIIFLAKYFVGEYCAKFEMSTKIIPDEMKKYLLTYSWPGNIRELRNTIENLVIMSGENKLLMCDYLPSNIIGSQILSTDNEDMTLKEYMTIKEREFIESRLKEFGANKTELAKKLGVSRKTLYERLNELGIKY